MNVILPRYSGAIAEFVVNEPVEVVLDDVGTRCCRNSAGDQCCRNKERRPRDVMPAPRN